MKITKIDITQYQQFKNFVLDLTYPEGHAKAGQPLDKVCFIGQSGTGKTTLLNLIEDFLIRMSGREHEHSYQDLMEFCLSSTHGDCIKLRNSKNIEVNHTREYEWYEASMLYITADILGNYQHLTKEKKEKELIGVSKTDVPRIESPVPPFFKLDNNVGADIWKSLLKKIDIFDEKVEEKNKELFRKLSTKDAQKIFEEFIEWKAAQKNPREELANKLAEILSLFQLEIDAEDTDNYLTVRAKNESGIIPSEGISTGTKSLILTTALLWGIGLDNTVVLFDEPERSLYPNVQRKLVDFYTEISPSSQYFFATHSPVIVASFEPWEIVELVFDENGYVFQKPYYEGERKVDNYFTDFRYLRWDDILMKGFGLMEEGNADFRTKELMQAARYRKQLEKMEKEDLMQSPDYQLTLEKYIKSAKRIGWNYEKNR
jgi:predicted ATPase